MSIHRSGFRAGRPLTVTRPARIHARASTREPSPAFDSTRSRVFSGRFDTLSRVNRVELAVRLIFVALLAAFTWRAARAGLDAERLGTFLHLPDLVFHEAGHIILSPFGRFVTVLGGSLFQVVVPVVCAVAFLRQPNEFGAAVCSWWAGQNLTDVAPYIADARALQLPLLGGGTGREVEGHDW